MGSCGRLLEQVATTLQPHVQDLRRIFRHFFSLGAAAGTINNSGPPFMTLTQFLKFLKEVQSRVAHEDEDATCATHQQHAPPGVE